MGLQAQQSGRLRHKTPGSKDLGAKAKTCQRRETHVFFLLQRESMTSMCSRAKNPSKAILPTWKILAMNEKTCSREVRTLNLYEAWVWTLNSYNQHVVQTTKLRN